MTRPLNPARTITAPYSADHPPPMPERIRALLGRRAADLTRAELLDIAADAANRDPWDLCGDREHVGAICDLAGTFEAELADLRAELAKEAEATRALADEHEQQGMDLSFHRLGHQAVLVELEAERKAHAATRERLEALLAAGATLPGPPCLSEPLSELRSEAQSLYASHRAAIARLAYFESVEGSEYLIAKTRAAFERLGVLEAKQPTVDQHPSGALETMLTTGPDEPGPHDAITVDSALDDDDDTRVATDEELRR